MLLQTDTKHENFDQLCTGKEVGPDGIFNLMPVAGSFIFRDAIIWVMPRCQYCGL
jgi:hypothetical protein